MSDDMAAELGHSLASAEEESLRASVLKKKIENIKLPC